MIEDGVWLLDKEPGRQCVELLCEVTEPNCLISTRASKAEAWIISGQHDESLETTGLWWGWYPDNIVDCCLYDMIVNHNLPVSKIYG